MAEKRRADSLRNELRIIGGRWRGRRLRFPPLPDIRPTLDRVRETLFNWLQFDIAGSRCLDLFAGSGALGLEALSRGAAKVVFVDREPAIARYLRDTLSRLNVQDEATVCVADAVKYLGSPPEPFDVVFLDPPFAETIRPATPAKERHPGVSRGPVEKVFPSGVQLKDLSLDSGPGPSSGQALRRSDGIAGLCLMLEEGGWLASPAFIYIETPSRVGPPELPKGWKLLKSKRAGAVGYHLARREGSIGFRVGE